MDLKDAKHLEAMYVKGISHDGIYCMHTFIDVPKEGFFAFSAKFIRRSILLQDTNLQVNYFCKYLRQKKTHSTPGPIRSIARSSIQITKCICGLGVLGSSGSLVF